MSVLLFFFFKQKTAYDMRISDWSSDVCSSDLIKTCCDARRLARPEVTRAARPITAQSVKKRKKRGFGCRDKSMVKLQRHSLIPRPQMETLRSQRWRSEERSVGKECVSKGRTRGEPYH